MEHPSAALLSLPRVLIGNPTIKSALKDPAPGMFLVNVGPDVIEQWVMDHWEVVGQWAPGDPSDDPLKDFQLAAQRAFGFLPGQPGVVGVGSGSGGGTAGGGGGTSPAAGGNVLTPGDPIQSECVTIVQDGDPGAVGEGRFWWSTSTNPDKLFIRNATNTGWIEVCQV